MSAREEITRLSSLVGTSAATGVGTVTVVPGVNVNGSVQVNGVSHSSSSATHAQPPSSSHASSHHPHSSRHLAHSPSNGRPSQSPTVGNVAPVAINVSLPNGAGKALSAAAPPQGIVANGRGYGY